LIGGAVAALALAVPLFASESNEQLASLIVIDAILAVSLVILTGWAGHVSLGHFALAGIGGATAGVLVQSHGWDLFAALTAGMAAAGLVALVIGLPALRIPGLFLAVTTLGFAVTASTFLLEDRYLPWFVPERVERPSLWGRLSLESDWAVYYLCLAALLVAIVALRNLRRTRFGRVLIAIRDDEAAAATVGIRATRAKLAAFTVSGAIAGLAGGLLVLLERGLQTDVYTPDASLRLFSMVVIGGLGSVSGAILGAVYVGVTGFYMRGGWALLATGFGVLVLLLYLPGGLGDALQRARDRCLRWIARRRKIAAPSLLGEERPEPDTTPVVLQTALEALGSSKASR
jgi:branched-chain amino acid transport system permease protein